MRVTSDEGEKSVFISKLRKSVLEHAAAPAASCGFVPPHHLGLQIRMALDQHDEFTGHPIDIARAWPGPCPLAGGKIHEHDGPRSCSALNDRTCPVMVGSNLRMSFH
jgi:hypothetical protein